MEIEDIFDDDDASTDLEEEEEEKEATDSRSDSDDVSYTELLQPLMTGEIPDSPGGVSAGTRAPCSSL